MEIPISPGEWMQSLQIRMNNAMEGDCFLLPTQMHTHAFEIVKQAHFPLADFKVRVGDQEG